MTTNYRTIFAACLAAAMIIVFAGVAAAQTPAGSLTLSDGTVFTPSPAPVAVSTAASQPLDEQMREVTGKYLKVVKAGEELKSALVKPTTDPPPAADIYTMNWNTVLLVILILVVIGAIALVASRVRQAPVAPVPAQPQPQPAPAPAPIAAPVPAAAVVPAPAPAPQQANQPLLVGSIPVRLNPLEIQVNVPPINLGLANQPQNPPLPAGVVAAGNCTSCGTPYNAGERFCHACGRVLPVLLVMIGVLAMMFMGSVPVMAQNTVRYHCIINGIEGVCQPPVKQSASPVVKDPADPKPVARRKTVPRRTYVRPAAPTITPAEIQRAVATGVADALKGNPLHQTAVGVAPGAPVVNQQMVDRLTKAESDVRAVVNQQNQLVDRIAKDEQNMGAIGNYANGVGRLASETAAAVIPKVSHRGGQNSPACRIYQSLVALGNPPSGRPPKGCQQ